MSQRIYILSFAPAYDEGGVGGCEWRRDFSNLVHDVTQGEHGNLLEEGCDYRIVTLDLPDDMSDDDISDFLGSGPGTDLIDPPDPRSDLEDALASWRQR